MVDGGDLAERIDSAVRLSSLLAGLAVAMVTRPTMWALLAAVVAAVALAPFTRPLRKGWVILGVGFVGAAVVAGALFYAMDPRRGHQTDAGDYERVFLQTLVNDPRGLREATPASRRVV